MVTMVSDADRIYTAVIIVRARSQCITGKHATLTTEQVTLRHYRVITTSLFVCLLCIITPYLSETKMTANFKEKTPVLSVRTQIPQTFHTDRDGSTPDFDNRHRYIENIDNAYRCPTAQVQNVLFQVRTRNDCSSLIRRHSDHQAHRNCIL